MSRGTSSARDSRGTSSGGRRVRAARLVLPADPFRLSTLLVSPRIPPSFARRAPLLSRRSRRPAAGDRLYVRRAERMGESQRACERASTHERREAWSSACESNGLLLFLVTSRREYQEEAKAKRKRE